MIISRTPFRVSFFGGGTDYPAWFEEHPGAVLATTIDKYCWITCRYLPPFFDHKSRIIYSKMEHVQKVADIEHPAVREVLKFMKIRQGIEIHHDGDLPARTGLGSSSSFTVGLLNSLYALRGTMVSDDRLAEEAIHVEQDLCKDNVGCQDQTLAAYGGFNLIEFGGSHHLRVKKVTIPIARAQRLQNHLMMFFSGFSRMASQIAGSKIQNIPKRQKELKTMYDMAFAAVDMLNQEDLTGFGQLLHEAWMIKRQLSDKVSTPVIDQMYETARKAGAVGGKLLGAGGGGFLLLFVPPERQARVKESLKDFLHIPFKFEHLGSQIIFYHPNSGKV